MICIFLSLHYYLSNIVNIKNSDAKVHITPLKVAPINVEKKHQQRLLFIYLYIYLFNFIRHVVKDLQINLE